MRQTVKILAIIAFLAAEGMYCFAQPKTLEGGFNLRSRHEYWENLFDLESDTDDIRNYFRFKASLWGRLNLTENINLYGKLTDEFKTYLHAPANVKTNFDINEVIFDNLYFDGRNILGLPIDIRIGRQDFLFVYGEGFLIMDGTPLDGSRTFYFNAAKATWHVDDKNTLDFLYITQPKNEQYLPILNEQKPKQSLSYSDEQAAVAYWKTDMFENAHAEMYYIYKHEDGGGMGIQAQEGEINTWGYFTKYNLTPVALRAQVAYQHGYYGSEKRTAWGGYFFTDAAFNKIMWKPSFSIGGICLSGDDPNTAKNEGWNPLFSRWPWMSELYVLSYAGESGAGYWTNLLMLRGEIGIVPAKNAKLRAWYNFLKAMETQTGALFGSGKTRGHLIQTRADYKFNKYISAYFLAEYLIPGNFYKDTAENAIFLRTEVTVKF